MHLGGLPGGIVGVVISDTPSSCQQLDVWCSHTLQSDRATDYPFIVFHLFSFEKRIYIALVRSYKILSPLECCRANIHCLNWQLLCLGPWYCGISAAAFRRSDLKEKSLSDILRLEIHDSWQAFGMWVGQLPELLLKMSNASRSAKMLEV